MYTSFAAVYDRLMDEVDYAAWADYYHQLLTQSGVPQGAPVVECACGTGALTIPLSQHYRMTGVDISEDMLSIAVQKAREAGCNIPFVRQDMTKLALHKKAAAVLCTCDGINYLTTKRQMQAFLSAAYRALTPGGVLALDFSSEHKLSQVLGDRVLTRVADDVCYIWHNQWEAARRRVHMQLDIFLQEEKGCYRRIVEQQVQQAWSETELAALVTFAGFLPPHFTGDRKPQVSPGEQRLHLVAIKPMLEEV